MAAVVTAVEVPDRHETATGRRHAGRPVRLRRARTPCPVDHRFREDRSVETYARELGLSAGHLGRLCRDTLGMSPQNAISARVVHEARRELVYSSLSVKQIAAVLGFQDEAYFGRFFRKHTGQRPTEFRQMARAHLART